MEARATLGRSALITGITGQDGSYLAETLLDRGYTVFGLQRRLSVPNMRNISHLVGRVKLLPGDLEDVGSLVRAVATARPDEVYNLAAQSFVSASWDQPVLTGQVTGLGATNLLEAVRQVKPDARFYQASSSEMYGNAASAPQHEDTPFRPRSPYGAAKAYAHHIAVNYRESYGMFVCCGILFNHESPRRGVEFVTRKVTRGVARIKQGLDHTLRLGNLDSRRDWGYAPEYVEAMWLMLQQPSPDDYVIATGTHYSVEQWVSAAFAAAGLSWRDFVETAPDLVRPAEIRVLVGDASKAVRQIGWRPRVGFEELVRLMVEADLQVGQGVHGD